MRTAALAFMLVALAAPPAAAALTENELAAVRADPEPGASLPLALPVQDIAGPQLTLGEALGGRPALLVPVDYACRSLCGPSLALLAPLLSATRLRMGRDFNVLIVGIDPRDGADAARAMTGALFGAGRPGLRVLTGGPDVIPRILGALGYRTAFDAQLGRIAHPAAAFAVSREGRIVRTLSTLTLDATSLDLAMTEAGGGRTGGLGGRLVLLCYGFDPARGIYTPAIRRILAAAGAVTLLGLGAGIAALRRRAQDAARAR